MALFPFLFKKRSNWQTLFSLFIFILGLLIITLFTACGRSENSAGYEYAKWTFSGIIRDGNTLQPLAGATVRYSDDQGEQIEVFSDSLGGFFIPSLPFGNRSFIFSYNNSKKDTESGKDSAVSMPYARRVIQIGSVRESQIEGVLANETQTIDLFPLSAGIQGFVQLKQGDEFFPAKNISVDVSYNDPEFINDEPSNFETHTDSTGFFKLTQLPADSHLVVTVGTVNQQNLLLTPVSIDLPKLRANAIRNLSAIQLKYQADPIQILESSTWSVSEQYQPNISTYDTITLVFSEHLMGEQNIRWFTDSTQKTIQASGSNANAKVIVSKDTLFVIPDDRFFLFCWRNTYTAF
jgi:hypothetical protein